MNFYNYWIRFFTISRDWSHYCRWLLDFSGELKYNLNRMGMYFSEYCTNRKVLAGFHDLKTVEPLVAAQWDTDKNAPLEPSMVLPGSTKRVWWRCIDGHEWKAVIYSRTGAQKHGCPVCAGKTPRQYRQ